MHLFHSRRHAIVFVITVVAVAVTAFAVQKPTFTALKNNEGIPYPFALQQKSPLLGSLMLIGFYNYPVWEASFDDDAVSELVQGAVHEDKITFVVTPTGSGISVGAPLCEAITVGTRYFGYEYSDRPASYERANAGVGPINNQFLPNNFITSAEQRAFDSTISDYEATHNVTFRDACAVTLKENARYVFVFNDANTTFAARNVEWCGDGITQVPEECDDDNLVDTDACTSSCELAACGDTFLQPLGADNQAGGGDDEQCDDGNTVNGDGCSSLCLSEVSSSSSSSSSASMGYCCINGDTCAQQVGCIQTLNECLASCGGSFSSSSAPVTSSSSSSSPAPICPNGIVEPPEECDDNNTVNTDQCTNACTTARCGDAIWQPLGADGIDQVPNGTSDDEECDDGNAVNTDSCDNQCDLPPIPIPPTSSSTSSAAPSSASSLAPSSTSAAAISSSAPLGWCCDSTTQVCSQGPGCPYATQVQCSASCSGF